MPNFCVCDGCLNQEMNSCEFPGGNENTRCDNFIFDMGAADFYTRGRGKEFVEFLEKNGISPLTKEALDKKKKRESLVSSIRLENMPVDLGTAKKILKEVLSRISSGKATVTVTEHEEPDRPIVYEYTIDCGGESMVSVSFCAVAASLFNKIKISREGREILLQGEDYYNTWASIVIEEHKKVSNSLFLSEICSALRIK